MVKKLIYIISIMLSIFFLIYQFPMLLDKINELKNWIDFKGFYSDYGHITLCNEEIEKLQKEILTLVICSVSLVSCAALIIAYPLRFSFQGYREKYDAWVQRRKEAAFQRKYRKAKKNMEQEKKKLEKMEKEKAGK